MSPAHAEAERSIRSAAVNSRLSIGMAGYTASGLKPYDGSIACKRENEVLGERNGHEEGRLYSV